MHDTIVVKDEKRKEFPKDCSPGRFNVGSNPTLIISVRYTSSIIFCARSLITAVKKIALCTTNRVDIETLSCHLDRGPDQDASFLRGRC
jgi:hypothetical protein